MPARFVVAFLFSAIFAYSASVKADKPYIDDMFTSITMGDLYRACQKAIEVMDKNPETSSTEKDFCLGYLGGFQDGYLWGAHKGESVYCVPENVKGIDTAKIFVNKMIQQRPDRLELTASAALMSALIEAYPCRKPFQTK